VRFILIFKYFQSLNLGIPASGQASQFV